MSELWQSTLLYRIGRKYIDSITRLSFSSVNIVGRENIPTDGSVIFAANHTNTLMDPLVQLLVIKGPIAFGARADVFNKPKVAKILHELKVVPIARMERDGADAASRNMETFEIIADCLAHGTPFGIFPEGRHRPMHSLLPVKKGVFRIAELTIKKCDRKVYIVPVGVDYEDYFHFGKGLRISYGEPIEVNSYLSRYESEGQFLHDISADLYERMSKLILFFPDDENYEKAFRKYQRRHRIRRPALHKFFLRILAVAILPVFLLFALLGWMALLPAALLVRKLKDKAWSNTIRFATIVATLPFQLLLNGILAAFLLPGALALLIVLLSFVAAPGFYRVLNYYRELKPEK